MTPTLVETPAGVLSRGLGYSQPEHGVGPLLRAPQAVLHGAMEVRHPVGHRWERRRRGDGGRTPASGRTSAWGGEGETGSDKIPGVSTQPGCMTEKWTPVCVFASCSVITTCCLCNTHTHTRVSQRDLHALPSPHLVLGVDHGAVVAASLGLQVSYPELLHQHPS